MADEAALPDPEREADVRPLPVLAEPRPVERPRRGLAARRPWPPRPAASCSAIATFVLVRVLRRPKPASLRLGRGRGRGKKVDVAGSRSFLVDIHLLKDR